MKRPTEATTGLPSAWAGRLSRSACRTSLANSWPFRNCTYLLLYSPFSALLGFESVTPFKLMRAPLDLQVVTFAREGCVRVGA